MSSDGFPPGLITTFIVIAVIIVVLGVGMSVWKAAVLRRGGLNPFVAREQLEARLNQSMWAEPPAAPGTGATGTTSASTGAAGKTKEDRLAEVMDLHERGIISDDELAAARTAIIND